MQELHELHVRTHSHSFALYSHLIRTCSQACSHAPGPFKPGQYRLFWAYSFSWLRATEDRRRLFGLACLKFRNKSPAISRRRQPPPPAKSRQSFKSHQKQQESTILHIAIELPMLVVVSSPSMLRSCQHEKKKEKQKKKKSVAKRGRNFETRPTTSRLSTPHPTHTATRFWDSRASNPTTLSVKSRAILATR